MLLEKERRPHAPYLVTQSAKLVHREVIIVTQTTRVAAKYAARVLLAQVQHRFVFLRVIQPVHPVKTEALIVMLMTRVHARLARLVAREWGVYQCARHQQTRCAVTARKDLHTATWMIKARAQLVRLVVSELELLLCAPRLRTLSARHVLMAILILTLMIRAAAILARHVLL